MRCALVIVCHLDDVERLTLRVRRRCIAAATADDVKHAVDDADADIAPADAHRRQRGPHAAREVVDLGTREVLDRRRVAVRAAVHAADRVDQAGRLNSRHEHVANTRELLGSAGGILVISDASLTRPPPPRTCVHFS